MGKTRIEWATDVWNPLVGCTRVSRGCERCYAERVVHRGLAERHRGLTKLVNGTPHWTGEVRLVESALDLPLRWKSPRRIFVNSMSDLFHEKVQDEWLDKIWRVMKAGALKGHTFQVLTKRPERMAPALRRLAERLYTNSAALIDSQIWLGVSVEDQATADERIPLLLQTPAAIRWVSYEPALGSVDFAKWIDRCSYYCDHEQPYPHGHRPERAELDWIVVGGESGSGARPFDLAWARSTIAQCRAASIPCFVKQLGANVMGLCVPTCTLGPHGMSFRDRKGGDPAEWPEDLRVREYPA